MKYFVEITDYGYVDKNRLHTDVKAAVRKHHCTLVHDHAALIALKKEIQNEVEECNRRHNRCTPLRVGKECGGLGLYAQGVFRMRVLDVKKDRKSKSNLPDPYDTLTGEFHADAH